MLRPSIELNEGVAIKSNDNGSRSESKVRADQLNDPAILEIRKYEIMVNSENFDFQQTATRFAVSSPDEKSFLTLLSHADRRHRAAGRAGRTQFASIGLGESLSIPWQAPHML
jgi:hypothetical protein